MRKKLLVGFLVDGKSGGTDMYIMNLIDILYDEYDIEVLCNKQSDFLDAYMQSRGVKCHYISGLNHFLQQYRELNRIISKGKFDISYLNASTAVMIMMPFLSWIYKIPVRVVHSHSSGIDEKNKRKRKVIHLLHVLGKKALFALSNRYFACSINAGKWMFPKKIVGQSGELEVIPNPIDIEKYAFHADKHNKMKADVKESIILGHVSNYQQVKNTRFLIDVLYELIKRKKQAKLLLIGEGDEKKSILQYAQQLGIRDQIIDMGYQQDTSDYYQMMDFFLLPSFFEGFPIVAIEAQAAKLSCLLSDRITRDAKMTQETVFLPIDDVEKWADVIIEKYPYDRTAVSVSDAIRRYDKKNFKEEIVKLL